MGKIDIFTVYFYFPIMPIYTFYNFAFSLPVEELSVRVGSSFKDNGGSIHKIYGVDYDMTKYNPRTLEYDEAAFYVSKFVKLLKNIQSVLFQIKDYEGNDNENDTLISGKEIKIEDGDFGNVTGWGKTLVSLNCMVIASIVEFLVSSISKNFVFQIGAQFCDQLQAVELPIVNRKVCQRSYPRLTIRYGRSMRKIKYFQMYIGISA